MLLELSGHRQGVGAKVPASGSVTGVSEDLRAERLLPRIIDVRESSIEVKESMM